MRRVLSLPPSRRPASRARGMHGSALTEFVIVGPVAILFTFVLLQGGLLYMAKLTLNNATFMAARTGATENASLMAMRGSLVKGLIPFYQDATETDDFERLSVAAVKSAADMALLNVRLTMLSPSDEAFSVYGISAGGKTYIPNDNLEFRTATPMHGASISIRDANVLRIRVTYAYELKVPLMKAVVFRIMCPFATRSEVAAWDNRTLLPVGTVADCFYYRQGRVPIVSFATVHMQSRAER